MPPLHALDIGPAMTIQFPDAVSLVRYARADYDFVMGRA
jgi:hypothetical protein